MPTRLHRATLFALYQLSIAISICLLPLALVVRQAGFHLPVHRVVDRLARAYDTVA